MNEIKNKHAISRLLEIKQKVETHPWYDNENGHIEADQVLTELLKDLGYTEVVELFESIEKWYA